MLTTEAAPVPDAAFFSPRGLEVSVPLPAKPDATVRKVAIEEPAKPKAAAAEADTGVSRAVKGMARLDVCPAVTAAGFVDRRRQMKPALRFVVFRPKRPRGVIVASR